MPTAIICASVRFDVFEFELVFACRNEAVFVFEFELVFVFENFENELPADESKFAPFPKTLDTQANTS